MKQADELRFNEDGLIPAIVQDAASKEVLTLAYMNKESYEKTLETKETWFYSRSRQALWHKGETSGNTQAVKGIRYDCDQDALLVLVEPSGRHATLAATAVLQRNKQKNRPRTDSAS